MKKKKRLEGMLKRGRILIYTGFFGILVLVAIQSGLIPALALLFTVMLVMGGIILAQVIHEEDNEASTCDD